MSDERRIRFAGEELGTFKFDALYRARMRGDFDHTAEFFSERKSQWLPLPGLLEDLETTVTMAERVRQMKEVGITKVKLLPGGTKGDCAVCRGLAKKVYPIDHLPTVPPEGCTCKPWCSLVALAHV
jgi:hypothetical protein